MMKKNKRIVQICLLALLACSMVSQPLWGCIDCFVVLQRKVRDGKGVKIIALLRNKNNCPHKKRVQSHYFTEEYACERLIELLAFILGNVDDAVGHQEEVGWLSGLAPSGEMQITTFFRDASAPKKGIPLTRKQVSPNLANVFALVREKCCRDAEKIESLDTSCKNFKEIKFYEEYFDDLTEHFLDTVGKCRLEYSRKKKVAIRKVWEEISFYPTLLKELLKLPGVTKKSNFAFALCKLLRRKGLFNKYKTSEQALMLDPFIYSFFQGMVGAHIAISIIDLFHFHETNKINKFFMLLGDFFKNKNFFCIVQIVEEMGYERIVEEKRCDEKEKDVLSGKLLALTQRMLRCCYTCGKSNDTMHRCSRCKLTPYCSVECQRANWKYHKKNCRVRKKKEVSKQGADLEE